jgi:Lanthionine synthetase C-like protein
LRVLWSPRRHEPLSAPPWDEKRACAAICEIASDAEARFDPDPRRLWPAHPLDEHLGPPLKGLYLGAAGAIWSLHHLAREGAIELGRPLAPELDGVLAAYRAAPDSGAVVPSLFLGEAGITLVAERLAPAPRFADRLYELIAANIDNPACELFWGSPGTMLAAVFLHEWTGEARWSALALACAERLFAEWRPARGAHLWTQRLYGDVLEYLGAAHGFAGNAHALLRVAPLLAPSRREELFRRCARVAAATAVVEGDCANCLRSRASSRAAAPTGSCSGAMARPEWRSRWPKCRPGSTHSSIGSCARRES